MAVTTRLKFAATPGVWLRLMSAVCVAAA